jgi:hypothetical protein
VLLPEEDNPAFGFGFGVPGELIAPIAHLAGKRKTPVREIRAQS